jgi:hypothetical protein
MHEPAPTWILLASGKTGKERSYSTHSGGTSTVVQWLRLQKYDAHLLCFWILDKDDDIMICFI